MEWEGVDGEEEEEDGAVVGRKLGEGEGAEVGRIAWPSCRRRKKSRSELGPQWKRQIDGDWTPARAIGDSREVAVCWKGHRSKMRR